MILNLIKQKKSFLLNCLDICQKISTLIWKGLFIDKTNFKYLFHDLIILFLDSFYRKSTKEKRFDNREKIRFILSRIGAHINPKIMSYSTISVFVDHSSACLVENVHQISVFEGLFLFFI